MSREISSERLRKDADRVIENPFWIGGIAPDKFYTRIQDDHDGTFKGSISVAIDKQGDAWVQFGRSDSGGPLRFRTFGGGGLSLRTRNALMLLAEAIRRDNIERPYAAAPAPFDSAQGLRQTTGAVPAEE